MEARMNAQDDTAVAADAENERAAGYLSERAFETRGDWSVWEGIAVEGRLAGVRTLFVGRGLTAEGLTALESILPDYAHVQFCIPFLYANGWEVPLRRVQAGQCTTLDLDGGLLVRCPALLRDQAHLVLNLNAPQFPIDFLKPTDTLRLVRGYLDVATVTYHHMRRTFPSLYHGDIRLRLAPDET